MRGANRFEEDALKHGRDDLIFFIREEKIVRGKRTRTSLRKRRKKRETRADKERAFKGSIRIARINIMHKYKRKTQTHTYLSYCDTQTSIVLLLWEALSCIIFHSLSFLLAYFPLFLSAQNVLKGLLFLLLLLWCIHGHIFAQMLHSSFSQHFPRKI